VAIKIDKLNSLVEWVNERTGAKSIWDHLMNEAIPGGTRWVYVLGSALLFSLTLQFFTGALLLLYYVPAAEFAHVSVAYIQKEVMAGSFIRGLHHYGTSIIVILAVLHMLRTFFWGSYKNKRELVWLAGVTLFFIILGFGFTGYLLPWDQKAYFGTAVAINLMSALPVIGEPMSKIALGGDGLSTLTLSRFFVIHVAVLPAILVLFTAGHLFLLRRANHSGDFRETPTSEPFFPKQFFKDSAFAFLLFGILSSISYFVPAPLEPEANPADASYIPRPEWYFLFLFQLLKYFPGNLVLIPAVIIPGIVFTIIFLLPFLDKNPERNPFKRPIACISALVLVCSVILITGLALRDDRKDPLVKTQLEKQTADGKAFLKTPFVPKTTGKAAETAAQASNAPAPAIYQAKCAACHGDKGQGQLGSKLINLSQKEKRSRDDIVKLLEDPQSYGLAVTMPKFSDLSEKERQELADWIVSLK